MSMREWVYLESTAEEEH